MSVYEYNEGEHGGGFIGLRVAVCGGSVLRQKYFSYVDKQGSKNRPTTFKSENEIALLLKDANKLNKQWIKQKEEKRILRVTFGPPLGACINSQWNTTIRGLTCRYKISDYRAENKALVFCISIFATNKDGYKLQITVNVSDETTINAIWRGLGRQLALARGLKRMPYKWMQRIPTEQDRKKMLRIAKKQYLAA